MKAAFLEDLSKTLDVKTTIKNLGITEDAARDILKSLVPVKRTGRAEVVAHPAHAVHAHHAEGTYLLWVDGASRGNPGKAGAGAVIKDHTGAVVKRLKRYLGVATNNVAEYSALIMGLTALRKMNATSIRVYADSELMVKHINGLYKVKSDTLRPLYEEALSLMKSFKDARIKHVYREENTIADELSNEAIDTAHTLF